MPGRSQGSAFRVVLLLFGALTIIRSIPGIGGEEDSAHSPTDPPTFKGYQDARQHTKPLIEASIKETTDKLEEDQRKTLEDIVKISNEIDKSIGVKKFDDNRDIAGELANAERQKKALGEVLNKLQDSLEEDDPNYGQLRSIWLNATTQWNRLGAYAKDLKNHLSAHPDWEAKSTSSEKPTNDGRRPVPTREPAPPTAKQRQLARFVQQGARSDVRGVFNEVLGTIKANGIIEWKSGQPPRAGTIVKLNETPGRDGKPGHWYWHVAGEGGTLLNGHAEIGTVIKTTKPDERTPKYWVMHGINKDGRIQGEFREITNLHASLKERADSNEGHNLVFPEGRSELNGIVPQARARATPLERLAAFNEQIKLGQSFYTPPSTPQPTTSSTEPKKHEPEPSPPEPSPDSETEVRPARIITVSRGGRDTDQSSPAPHSTSPAIPSTVLAGRLNPTPFTVPQAIRGDI